MTPPSQAERAVLILTDRVDPHAEVVLDRLQERGVRAVRFHPRDLGAGFEASGFWDGRAERVWFTTPGAHAMGLDELGVVYNRGWKPVDERPMIPDPGARAWTAAESGLCFRYLLGLLDNRPWLTHPVRVRSASRKARQLRLASSIGLVTPRTLWSNDPDDILRFARDVGRVVLKPMEGIRYELDGQRMGLWPVEVEAAELRRNRRGLELTFGCYQELIENDHDLRVTVIGERLFACAIRSGASAVDYRAESIPHSLHAVEVDETLGTAILALHKALGIRFSCMDFVVRPDGVPVFIEANVNGQWLWVEQQTDLPIAAAVAQELQTLASLGRPWSS